MVTFCVPVCILTCACMSANAPSVALLRKTSVLCSFTFFGCTEI